MATTYGVLMKNGVNYSHDTAASISYDNSSSGLTATNAQAAFDEIAPNLVPTGGTTAKFLRGDGWQVPDVTTYGIVSTADNGLVPSGGTSAKYLRADGSWQTPTNTTYPIGNGGLVRKLTGSTLNYFRGDGTWQNPNTTYGVVTTALDGLVPSGGTSTKYLRADGTWQEIANTDDAIQQVPVTTEYSGNYRVFLSATSDDTTRTTWMNKSDLIYSPYGGDLYMFQNKIRMRCDQTYIDGYLAINCPALQQLIFAASNEAEYKVFYGVRESSWCLCPNTHGKLRLGTNSYRWNFIFAVNGTIQTSDRNLKKNIKYLDSSIKDFIMDLKPVSYKWKNEKPKYEKIKPITHDRTHYGLIAQDVEETMNKFGMTAMDFAGFCKDQKMEEYKDEDAETPKNADGSYVLGADGLPYKPKKQRPIEGEYVYGLRYEEFISPMIKVIQLQEEEIQSRKLKINELKARLDKLENK